MKAMKDKRTSLAAYQGNPVARFSFALLLLILILNLNVRVDNIDEIAHHRSDAVVGAQSPVLRPEIGDGALTIGGFDASRGGLGSFPSGDFFADARAAITETLPAVAFSAFSTLTQQATANVDILVLSSVTGETSATVPLSSQEQSALMSFVEAGGCAIVLLDNDSFATNASQANASLADPFGMVVSGTLPDPLIAMVPDPALSPVTTGPNGKVSSFIQSSPGGLTDLGPYATPLATNALGHALALVERDLPVAGSGPVVVFSDTDSFRSADAGGYFQSNRGLFLNTIAFCLSRHNAYLPFLQKDAACTVNETTSGQMTEDENWCRDVLITGSMQIAPGVTLTIQPGVTIRFKEKEKEESDNQYNNREFSPKAPLPSETPSIQIVVFGTLYAHGTSTEPIVFTSGHDVPGPRDWDSIAIEEDGMVSLDHVVLEHGYFGLQVNTPTSQAAIRHSTFRHVTTTGIATGDHPIDGPIIVSDSRFLDCGREAIDTYRNQNFVIRHNIFSDNYVAIMSVGSSVIIESNLFTGNIRGIGVVESGNPTIVGNEFTTTDGAAIFVTDASPRITYNNLYTNVLNLELTSSTLGVTAEHNWWGSCDVNAIAASIWDGVDDPALGLVDFEPYATDPFDLDVPQ